MKNGENKAAKYMAKNHPPVTGPCNDPNCKTDKLGQPFKHGQTKVYGMTEEEINSLYETAYSELLDSKRRDLLRRCLCLIQLVLDESQDCEHPFPISGYAWQLADTILYDADKLNLLPWAVEPDPDYMSEPPPSVANDDIGN